MCTPGKSYWNKGIYMYNVFINLLTWILSMAWNGRIIWSSFLNFNFFHNMILLKSHFIYIRHFLFNFGNSLLRIVNFSVYHL